MSIIWRATGLLVVSITLTARYLCPGLLRDAEAVLRKRLAVWRAATRGTAMRRATSCQTPIGNETPSVRGGKAVQWFERLRQPPRAPSLDVDGKRLSQTEGEFCSALEFLPIAILVLKAALAQVTWLTAHSVSVLQQPGSGTDEIGTPQTLLPFEWQGRAGLTCLRQGGRCKKNPPRLLLGGDAWFVAVDAERRPRVLLRSLLSFLTCCPQPVHRGW